jgi:hypothetical protein
MQQACVKRSSRGRKLEGMYKARSSCHVSMRCCSCLLPWMFIYSSTSSEVICFRARKAALACTIDHACLRYRPAAKVYIHLSMCTYGSVLRIYLQIDHGHCARRIDARNHIWHCGSKTSCSKNEAISICPYRCNRSGTCTKLFTHSIHRQPRSASSV